MEIRPMISIAKVKIHMFNIETKTYSKEKNTKMKI